MNTCQLEFRSIVRRRRYLLGPNYKHSTPNEPVGKRTLRLICDLGVSAVSSFCTKIHHRGATRSLRRDKRFSPTHSSGVKPVLPLTGSTKTPGESAHSAKILLKKIRTYEIATQRGVRLSGLLAISLGGNPSISE